MAPDDVRGDSNINILTHGTRMTSNNLRYYISKIAFFIPTKNQ